MSDIRTAVQLVRQKAVNVLLAVSEHHRFSGRGRQLNALLGSRHASLYPPSRCRTTLHDLPRLCAPADAHQGRRTTLEHGEDRLHL